jgi:hypothetical protein
LQLRKKDFKKLQVEKHTSFLALIAVKEQGSIYDESLHF